MPRRPIPTRPFVFDNEESGAHPVEGRAVPDSPRRPSPTRSFQGLRRRRRLSGGREMVGAGAAGTGRRARGGRASALLEPGQGARLAGSSGGFDRLVPLDPWHPVRARELVREAEGVSAGWAGAAGCTTEAENGRMAATLDPAIGRKQALPVGRGGRTNGAARRAARETSTTSDGAPIGRGAALARGANQVPVRLPGRRWSANVLGMGRRHVPGRIRDSPATPTRNIPSPIFGLRKERGSRAGCWTDALAP